MDNEYGHGDQVMVFEKETEWVVGMDGNGLYDEIRKKKNSNKVTKREGVIISVGSNREVYEVFLYAGDGASRIDAYEVDELVPRRTVLIEKRIR